MGWAGPGPVDKSEGLRGARLAQALSIKVRNWGRAWLIEVRGLANRSEGLGAGLAQALSTSGTHAQAHTISSLTLQQMARMRSLEE